jgi:hypothetical protein
LPGVEPAFGYVLGWNYLMKYLIPTPNNNNLAGAVIQYWTRHIHIAVWMSEPFPNLTTKVLASLKPCPYQCSSSYLVNPHHDCIGFRHWTAFHECLHEVCTMEDIQVFTVTISIVLRSVLGFVNDFATRLAVGFSESSCESRCQNQCQVEFATKQEHCANDANGHGSA